VARDVGGHVERPPSVEDTSDGLTAAALGVAGVCLKSMFISRRAARSEMRYAGGVHASLRQGEVIVLVDDACLPTLLLTQCAHCHQLQWHKAVSQFVM